MTYAKIENGKVTNLIEVRTAQAHEFPDCVPLNDIPAGIGDTYSDGVFYRNGEQVKSVSQQLAEAIADTNSAFAILRGEE